MDHNREGEEPVGRRFISALYSYINKPMETCDCGVVRTFFRLRYFSKDDLRS